MKISFGFLLIGISVLLMGSCKGEITERDDYKSVMEVHDEAMAKMGQIHDLRKKLNSWKESATDSSLIVESVDLVKALDNADEGMMSWMSEFRIPESGSEEELKKYFESEQVKVDKVSSDINQSISMAQKFIEDHE